MSDAIKKVFDELRAGIREPTFYVHPWKFQPERPSREDYVRVTVTHDDWTLEPAIEYRDGDEFERNVRVLRSIAGEVAARPLGDPMARARECATIIARCWPDRAYFVEVWQEGREGFAQVFQPFGVPRNR